MPDACTVSLLDVHPYHCTRPCIVLIFFLCPTIRFRALTLVNTSSSSTLFCCGTGLPEFHVCIFICSGSYSSSTLSLRPRCLNTPHWCSSMFAQASGFECADLFYFSYHSVFVTSPSSAWYLLFTIGSLPSMLLRSLPVLAFLSFKDAGVVRSILYLVHRSCPWSKYVAAL